MRCYEIDSTENENENKAMRKQVNSWVFKVSCGSDSSKLSESNEFNGKRHAHATVLVRG